MTMISYDDIAQAAKRVRDAKQRLEAMEAEKSAYFTKFELTSARRELKVARAELKQLRKSVQISFFSADNLPEIQIDIDRW